MPAAVLGFCFVDEALSSLVPHYHFAGPKSVSYHLHGSIHPMSRQLASSLLCACQPIENREKARAVEHSSIGEEEIQVAAALSIY
jgi:hypothetical protein